MGGCEKEMTESADEKFDGGQKIDWTPFYCPWDYLIPQTIIPILKATAVRNFDLFREETAPSTCRR